MTFEDSLEWARKRDAADPLAPLRAEFLFPEKAPLYFAGHSLGLQPPPRRAESLFPKNAPLYSGGHPLGLQPGRAREYVLHELDEWARHGVEGHFAARHP